MFCLRYVQLFYGDENVSQNFLAIKVGFFFLFLFLFWYNKKETETGIGHKVHPKRHPAKQSISILITPVYFAGFTFTEVFNSTFDENLMGL